MKRFAIYYAPHENSPLWQFGSAVLGYDAAANRDVDYPSDPIFQDPAALAFTAAPRRYGFHATLTAPFHLASHRSEDELRARLAGFASERRAFTLPLKLASVGEFLALVQSGSASEINQLADDCVRAFDAYRAPLTPSDRERRHPERLEPGQSENLDRWGYPYVFADFRFHMTLTGDLPLDDRLRLAPVLEDMFALVPPETIVDAVSLFVQDDADGRFRINGRFPFTAS